MNNVFIHKSADVDSGDIGSGTSIWQHVVVMSGAKIGGDVNLCAHCLVESGVTIGDRVTVKSGVYLWDGIRLEDDVFIGPNVTFTNDKYPRSKVYPERFLTTVVEKNASIGGGAVLLPGIRIGEGAMVGAGAVVTQSVPPYAIVTGSPARIMGYVSAAEAKSPYEYDPISMFGSSKEKVARVGIGGVALHRLALVQDMRGDLSVGEFATDLPFVPSRYFLIFNVPSEKTRGEHAHYQCHQFLICVKGSCAVVVDDGKSRCEVTLGSPDIGIYIPPMTWGIQYKYSPDAVLLVFASHAYDSADYIRSYAMFRELAQCGSSSIKT